MIDPRIAAAWGGWISVVAILTASLGMAIFACMAVRDWKETGNKEDDMDHDPELGTTWRRLRELEEQAHRNSIIAWWTMAILAVIAVVMVWGAA